MPFVHLAVSSKIKTLYSKVVVFDSKTALIYLLRAFDVELLYIAEELGIPIEEVAVKWTEIEGTWLLHKRPQIGRNIGITHLLLSRTFS